MVEISEEVLWGVVGLESEAVDCHRQSLVLLGVGVILGGWGGVAQEGGLGWHRFADSGCAGLVEGVLRVGCEILTGFDPGTPCADVSRLLKRS